MKIAVVALLSVVSLDLMNQALVFPILNTIVMDPAHGILPEHTTVAERHLDFGLLMGAFFLCWFLGAAYISKISDFIGRKEGILICLAGNFLGYVLIIVAVELSSFWLLLFARMLSGFTAGNQPIAQAALIDISESDQQKTRYMGLILLAVSVGLVAGPLIGGLLSDKAVLGRYASVELPFYCVAGMVLISLTLIIMFFHNTRTERQPFEFKPLEVFLTLWEACKRPVILKLSLVFFFGQLSLNACYVFMSNYYYSRFQFDTLQNSIALVILGVGLGFGSSFLVGPITARFSKIKIISTCLALMGVSVLLSIVNPSPFFAYVLVLPFIIPFSIYFPAMMTLFSLAVSDSEQGWVMGVSVALYTLGAGLVALVGGELMSISIHLPFMIAVASSVIALILILTLWRGDDIRALDRK